MTEFIEISWTCSAIDEARKVARFLVQARLVACAQLQPLIESIYMWNNQLETTQEVKVFLKAHRRHLDVIIQIILDNSSYQVPEIIFSAIEGGNGAYLQWLEESTTGLSEDVSITAS
jgi:periplasmic divalent cation tolerance protein